MFGQVGIAYRYFFALRLGSGAPRTGAVAAVTARVRDPADTTFDTPVVNEVSNGQYFIDIAASFTTTNGPGEYGVLLEVTTAPRDTFSESIPFFDAAIGQLDSGTVALISDTVWDEPVADHVTLGTTGRALFDSVSGIPIIDNDLIADAVWDEAVSDHLALGTTGRTLHDTRSGIPALISDTVDGVWDESLVEHLGAGSTGEALNIAASGLGDGLSLDEIADAVWDETIADHSGAGSAGLELQNKAEPGDAMDLVADAVDAASLATSAVDEIADGVWDEAIAGHLSSGSTGEALNFAASGLNDGLSLDSIADAVWDETIADHSTAGSAGLELQNKAEPGDAMDLVADAVDAASLATSAVDEIADGVWDEALSGHLALGSAGRTLHDTRSGIPALISDTADAVWDEPLAEHLGTGSTGEALNISASGLGDGLTLGEIADAVWDETIADHSAAGSAGLELQNKAEPGDEMDLVADAVDSASLATSAVDEIVDANWDEAIAGHLGAGSTGEALNIAASGLGDGLTLGSIADAVWDETMSEHLTAGSTGAELNSKAEPGDAMDLVVDAVDASSLATSAVNEIADGVWDEPIADHLTPSSTGEALNFAASGLGSDFDTIADEVWSEDLPQTFPLDSAGERLATIDDTVASIVANQPDEPFTITDATIALDGFAVGKIVVEGVIPEGIVVAFADTDPDLTTALFSAAILNDGSYRLVVDRAGSPIYRVTAVADRFTDFTVVRVQV